MTADEVVKGIYGFALTLIGLVLAGLVRTVMGNRDAAKIHEEKITALEVKVKEVEKTKLTKEDIREVVDAVFAKRDKANADRRVEWDKRLSLEIKAAVLDSVKDCKASHRFELEMLVDQIKNSKRPSGSGEVPSL